LSLLPWNEHPQAPSPETIICLESDIPELGGKAFTMGLGKRPFSMFVLKDNGIIRAYINGCTHFTGTPLNPNKIGNFLDLNDSSLIYCGVHGSRFLVSTGACVFGDCDGEGLQPVPVLVRDGQVLIG